jgi:hypothetical protein
MRVPGGSEILYPSTSRIAAQVDKLWYIRRHVGPSSDRVPADGVNQHIYYSTQHEACRVLLAFLQGCCQHCLEHPSQFTSRYFTKRSIMFGRISLVLVALVGIENTARATRLCPRKKQHSPLHRQRASRPFQRPCCHGSKHSTTSFRNRDPLCFFQEAEQHPRSGLVVRQTSQSLSQRDHIPLVGWSFLL